MKQSSTFSVTELSLPKGGGNITGMGEAMTPAGHDGMAGLSLPLPISAGRGYAPSLSLSYSSGLGNGPFGLGWQCPVMAIRRRTHRGVPHYDKTDTFLGPDGEVLVAALNETQQPDIRSASTLQGVELGDNYIVTGYHSRQEQQFNRFEYWQPKTKPQQGDFWLIYGTDGQKHLLGRNTEARIFNPQQTKSQHTEQTAQWLLESSVSTHGEQIYYEYRCEDDMACSLTEIQLHPQSRSQRYLFAVHYGNISASDQLLGLDTNKKISIDNWLFHLVFDYGERSVQLSDKPAFTSSKKWLCREDCFSRYEYGFEVRTRRLCRQILMYHNIKALDPSANNDDIDQIALVVRLILQYDEKAVASTLMMIQRVGHEIEKDKSGVFHALPPLELSYQPFELKQHSQWQSMEMPASFYPHQHWQFVDLKGEGIPGLLYQERGSWWYRAPQRSPGKNQPDAVIWDDIQPLPAIPSLQENASLFDINGDGQLDWIITGSGLQGYYSQRPDGDWTNFTPIQALPVEYFHPRAQLADIIGAGLSDLVLIGPKSVRLYANQRTGFNTGQTVIQSEGITLPVPGMDARRLVAFSDMLGSGQAHLVEINANGVTCWPNLGQGRFGQPLALSGFNLPENDFNPDRVYLADIDSSGTTDLIYACADHLRIFINQSGNHFVESETLPLPQNMRFDNTCQLQVADIQGLGVASLILSQAHGGQQNSTQHWRYDLAKQKPWLLNEMNNNMGAHHTLHYRSSAQFWLDEKAALIAAGKKPVCYLPFPIHTLWQTEITDEISGNRLINEVRYKHGAWDRCEREFRGFGYVEQRDTNQRAQGSASERTAPALSKNWYATGLPEIDKNLSEQYWQGDQKAFAQFNPRFTIWKNNDDAPLTTPDTLNDYWFNRALKGQLLRSELYGLDNNSQESIPYTVSEHRPQVRRFPAEGNQFIYWTSVLESRQYHYERISRDPQCNQSVTLKTDKYGHPLQQISIQYPRRPLSDIQHAYPKTLPANLPKDSDDKQQHVLRLNHQLSNWYHLVDTEYRVLGLPHETRQDAFIYNENETPANGFTLEKVNELLKSDKSSPEYLGQQRTFYTDGSGKKPIAKPTPQALVAFTETAIFTKSQLSSVFDGKMTEQERNDLLKQGGYQKGNIVCFDTKKKDKKNSPEIWVARQGYTNYGGSEQFWRPMTQRNSLLTGQYRLTWDPHYCVITKTKDAAGLTTRVKKYDWRFLLPVHLVDINDNHHFVTLDTLGRFITQRFWGTEEGKTAGYSEPQDAPFPTSEQPASDCDTTIKQLVVQGKPLPVANYQLYYPASWMLSLKNKKVTSLLNSSDWQALDKQTISTEDGYIRTLSLHRWIEKQLNHTILKAQLNQLSRLPPHSLTLITDRYDSDSRQQIHQQVIFSDGFGRPLQSAMRHEEGEAWQRTSDGKLIAKLEKTKYRWAVTGRTEYDNKGQVIRSYQPYYLDNWRYVTDDSTRKNAYADTHYYDPVGREISVKTAKDWLRRVQYYPWFTVSEDENDTAAEIAEKTSKTTP
ncbi:SpvB/TcaC N-terminal domain-containing protein [Xenorhabdus nematophila]|uniref:SpvB/TcaC N-terminal domain-containing protein n=1 Tax=Xenorhabdus nematophila TaxID=628 RepID=UPI00039F07AC|nr:SpvB/TcaC N-terminal domain-containing protein [Xenorhabdus nematophila]